MLVLKETDTGLLYIKDNSNYSYVIRDMEVNLKLPYLKAVNYTCFGYYAVGTTYGISNGLYKYVKIEDRNFVEKYLNVKNSNGDITTLEDYLPDVPSSGYSSGRAFISYHGKDDGLYLLWIKLSGYPYKDIYGCIIHDGLPEATSLGEYIQGLDLEAPTVRSIKVISPDSGTYSIPQTIKLGVYFSEQIKGSTTPTLKVKFGDSDERSLTNGTIINTGDTTSCIEYTYNVQDGDIGQLQTVSLTGGNITDESDNVAVLSCPVLIGNITIKANVEETNNTENQDNTNEQNTDNSAENKEMETTTNKSTDTNNTSESKEDTTTIKGKLPQTGVDYKIIVVMTIVAVLTTVLYVKYKNISDIK